MFITAGPEKDSSYERRPYKYPAKVAFVHGGDTCTVDLDVGLSTWIQDEKIRLARINTPEHKGDEREAGLHSRDFLREFVSGKEVFIETEKDKKGKYDRCIGKIWLEQSPDEWINVNELLVEKGYAEYKRD